MSLLKSKSFLTGILLTILLATTGSVLAFDGFRLWAPYQPESFGGGRRSNDGVYGSLEGIYWKVGGPGNIPIGYRTPDGASGTRLVYDGHKTALQGNSMTTSALKNDFNLGTRIEFGNVRGHHGWLVSGYGLSDSNSNFELGKIQNSTSSFADVTETIFYGQGANTAASMVIKDPENLTVYTVFGPFIRWNDIWKEDGTFNRMLPTGNSLATTEGDQDTQTKIENIGYFWGWIPIDWSDSLWGARLVPLPINFSGISVSNSTDITSVELMYTYRPHPFKWGEMDFLAGVRYWDFNDDFRFTGYSYTDVDDDQANNTGLDDDGDWVIDRSSITSKITGSVHNRITGPQIGMKLMRRNARWTFGAEGRFMAGINSQSRTVSGSLATQFIDTQNISHEAGSTTMHEHGINPYDAIGLINRTNSFHHHSNNTVFSPGAELRLSAKWQWTDAIGIKFGFNSTVFDNIGRGADVIEYKIQDNGQLFGLRTSKTTVLTYGFNIGLDMRR